ncbi:hypothetical protein THAR02_05875 [Trichoderma harzianum]|uniref:Uncharacterized protein n=1 Tax=Trichoderma harzianum TaxID=5544 RepID=A0A0F9XC00_TRIHA|nr:hypothetical protein THAR02_05875 [Trichoderma harzianum]
MSLLALPRRDDITGEEATASDKAACSVVADDVVGKQLDGIGFCVWEETDEVMTDPAKKLDKHEFASMLLADSVQDMIEDRIQDSYLTAPGWTRAQKHWSGSLIKELLHVFPPVPSTAVSTVVWYRLTNFLSYTDSMDIEEDSTSTNGNMRITLAPNDAKQPGQYWKFQSRSTRVPCAISAMALPGSVLGVHPNDETRLRLEPAAFAKGQHWRIIQRGDGVV